MVQAVSGGSREDRGLGAEWTSNVQDVITHRCRQGRNRQK